MDDQYFADCIERGIRLYWHTLASLRNMELHTGDIEYVMGNPRGSGPERAFNARLLPEAARQRIGEVAEAIRAGTMPNGVLLTRESTPAGVADLFAEVGFEIDTSGICMALDLAELKPASSDAARTRTLVVESPAQLKQWVDIINVAFAGEPIMTHDQFRDLHDLDYARMYLASWDGTPAAVAMTLRDGDTATLELVATLADYRRRGLGGAVITLALHQLRAAGVRTVTLRAEPDGIGLYHNLGFRDFYPRTVATLPRRN